MKRKIIYTLTSLACTASLFAQPAFIANGDFETWVTTNTVTEPKGWSTLNMLSLFGQPATTTQTNDAHTGSSAALLETKAGSSVDLPGLLTSALILDGQGNPDLNLARVPFTSRPKSMSFFYKYMPATGDSATGVMLLTRWNTAEQRADTVGVAAFSIGNTVASYTQAVVVFEYINPLPPDSAMLIIASSADGFAPIVGSKLYIDDFNIGFETGINEWNNTLGNVNVYPNPASQAFTIQTKETEFAYSVLDITGKEVLNGVSTMADKSVAASMLNPGLYLIQIKSKNGVAYQRLIIK